MERSFEKEALEYILDRVVSFLELYLPREIGVGVRFSPSTLDFLVGRIRAMGFDVERNEVIEGLRNHDEVTVLDEEVDEPSYREEQREIVTLLTYILGPYGPYEDRSEEEDE